MKSFVSFFVILILLQTLTVGSLVKLELPEFYTDKWEETRIDKHVVLDPFLMPGKAGFEQNFQNRNDWLSFHFIKTWLIRNNTVSPEVSESQSQACIFYKYKNIPVFILNGALRI